MTGVRYFFGSLYQKCIWSPVSLSRVETNWRQLPCSEIQVCLFSEYRAPEKFCLLAPSQGHCCSRCLLALFLLSGSFHKYTQIHSCNRCPRPVCAISLQGNCSGYIYNSFALALALPSWFMVWTLVLLF